MHINSTGRNLREGGIHVVRRWTCCATKWLDEALTEVGYYIRAGKTRSRPQLVNRLPNRRRPSVGQYVLIAEYVKNSVPRDAIQPIHQCAQSSHAAFPGVGVVRVGS